MNKIIYIFLFFFALETKASNSYDSTGMIPGTYRFMTTDPLGTLYLVKDDYSIEKYDISGNLLKQVNHKVFGPLKSIDASNPFELYLYYQESGKVVITDNQLSIRGEIDLNSHLVMPASIARTFDNGLWIFDQSDMELKKFSKSMMMTQHSGNVLGIIDRKDLNIQSIADHETRVYVNNTSSGILVFDNFTNYIKTLPFPDLDAWQVNGDLLYFKRGNQLITYQMSFFNETSTELKVSSGWKQFRISGERLFLLYANQVVLLNQRN